ncbi:MAG: glutamate 5-kinase [Deltaproteobacteria bacterium]|nr:glutamate 5-kinase [Deltaproteobacteria bacterium]
MKKRRRRRWVVKAGSNMVCSGGPLLARAWMQQLGALKREHGVEVIWVTSGAIASATERTHFLPKGKRTLSEKQALSAIGQPLVMDLYNLALQTTGMLGAQVLLTYDDLSNRERRSNFANTLEQLLKWDVTPILNENDAVATEEIKFGDNDSLSAKIAAVMKAERLIILTDVEGLYDSDPRRNPSAELVHSLARVTPKLLAQTGSHSGSSRGTGGMYSKLKAAREAGLKGIETWLVKGDLPHVLTRVADDEIVGTRIRVTRAR